MMRSGGLSTFFRKLAANLEGDDGLTFHVPGPASQDFYRPYVIMRVERGRHRSTVKIDLSLADAYTEGAGRYVTRRFEQAYAEVKCAADEERGPSESGVLDRETESDG